MKVQITREELQSALNTWSVDFLNEIEEHIGRELTEEELKKILIHGLGFAESYEALLEAIL